MLYFLIILLKNNIKLKNFNKLDDIQYINNYISKNEYNYHLFLNVI